jgi:hypothetical protein
LTYALAAESRSATAKPRQQIRLFDLISIKLKYLHVMLANLSGLRQRCGEPAAKSRHRNLTTYTPCGRIWIFARRRDGKRQVSSVNACHEIAENIPQRSRTPAMFHWACA